MSNLATANSDGAVIWTTNWCGFILACTPPVGTNPVSVTAADVNGDGWLDLVCANYGDGTLTVLTNNRNGGFGFNARLNVGSYPWSVTAADVNKDGWVDLICANSGDDTLTVLTNNGHGGFVTASSPSVGFWPVSVTAADVNGDGLTDLICANYGDDTLTVLINNGHGGFTIASSPGVGLEPLSVTAADVNGDGWVDLVCANYGDNTLTVLINNGHGGFAIASSPGVGFGPLSVTAADVNGDGWVDLVCANSGDDTLTVLINNGHGSFAIASSPAVGDGPDSVVAADVNGDGWADLICANYDSNTLTVLTNNRSGGFVIATSPSVGLNPHSVTAADVNNDGRPDLISANYNANTLTVLTNALCLELNWSGDNTFNGTVVATNHNNQFAGSFSGKFDGDFNGNFNGILSGDGSNVKHLKPENFDDGTVSAAICFTNPDNCFAGDGYGLTDLQATNLVGTIPDARLSTNVATLNGTNLFTGTNIFAGVTMLTNWNNVYYGTFAGDGYGLTHLNANNLTGVLPDSVLSGSYSGEVHLSSTVNTFSGAFAGNLTGNADTATTATKAGSATSFTGDLGGDVTGKQGSTVVSLVGGQAATDVASSVIAANAATSDNTHDTIVKRDADGNFSAGTIIASLAGNATTANTAGSANSIAAENIQPGMANINISGNAATVTHGVYDNGAYANPSWIASLAGSKIAGDISGNAATATTAGSATSFSGSLLGDVTGAQGATVVASVGGQTATDVASGVIATTAATSDNTASTIVKRDADGNFTAGVITASLAGNATTATHATTADNATHADSADTATTAGSATTATTATTATSAATATTATTAGSATSFTGDLDGDVTGSQLHTVVSFVGGQSAADVADSVIATKAATSDNTASTIVKRDADGNFTAGVITATSFHGDGSALTGLTVDSIHAENILAGTAPINISGNAATVTHGVYDNGTYANPGWITSLAGSKIAGDISGNAATATFATTAGSANSVAAANIQPGTANISISGSAATANTATTAGSATSFSGSLLGDVTGAQGATVVASVGGQSAADVADSVIATKAATSDNTASTIVKRDADGNFTAGVITATSFHGDGSALTGLTVDSIHAENILAGTAPINISGNAATVTHGVYDNGTYANPGWITSLAGSKIAGDISGNAATATFATTAGSANSVAAANIQPGTANISISGSAATANTATTAGSATSFSGSLLGDVTGAQGATVVASVGGQSAADVADSVIATKAATSDNTASTIVKRDADGNFTAGVITATSFHGDGSALTGLTVDSIHAENILAGTAPINISGNAATVTHGVYDNGTYANPGWITSLAGSKIAGDISGNAATATFATTAGSANSVAAANIQPGTANISISGSAATANTATTAGSATSFSGSLLGDVTGAQGATVVASVGGQSAADVADSVIATKAATSDNTASTIVKRDADGNFTAGVITATSFHGDGSALTGLTVDSIHAENILAGTAPINISGNAATATTATTAGSATSFSGSLAGDVVGTQGATVVSKVGGQLAALVASGGIAANVASSANTASTIVKRDTSGNFSAGTITASLAGNATTATTATTANNFSGSLTGDVTGTQGATVVSKVGTQTAALVVSGVSAANAAASANTASTIVKRDASGNFLAGTITASLAGNANTATTAGSATSFSGSLAGDVTGTQGATVVASVGGQTAALVASGASAANTAASANTPDTIVKRDGSGNFTAGTITASLAGNANTATTAGSATSFSGSLAGDVTGTQGATVVAGVGGQTAAMVASGASAANAAASANVPNTLVKRDTSGNFTAGTITASSFVGNGFGLTSLNATNLVGTITNALQPPSIVIGTNLIAPLTVAPRLPVSALGSAGTATAPVGVVVAGRYAYVVSQSGSFQAFDVSYPATPVPMGVAGTGGNLRSVAVAGRYAYAVDSSSSILYVVDVSNGTLGGPVIVGSATTASGPISVAVAGRYAYVVTQTGASGSLQIFDVNNPANPVLAGSTGTGSSPTCVTVAGRYAYVVNGVANTLQIFDVSNPTSPASVGSVTTGSSPNSVAVSGRYAYVVNQGASTLQVFDVGNASSPAPAGSTVTANMPVSVVVAGRYAYVVCNGPGPVLQIFDVSNPGGLVSLGSVGTGNGPRSVAVSGRFACLVNGADSTLQTFDLGGAYVQQLEAGTIETGTLQTRDTVAVGNGLDVRGGLTASGSARVSGGLGVDSLKVGTTATPGLGTGTSIKAIYAGTGSITSSSSGNVLVTHNQNLPSGTQLILIAMDGALSAGGITYSPSVNDQNSFRIYYKNGAASGTQNFTYTIIVF